MHITCNRIYISWSFTDGNNTADTTAETEGEQPGKSPNVQL